MDDGHGWRRSARWGAEGAGVAARLRNVSTFATLAHAGPLLTSDATPAVADWRRLGPPLLNGKACGAR